MITYIRKITLYLLIFSVLCLSTGTAQAARMQRSIMINPYPKEKIEKLEHNIASIAGPAQKLAESITVLGTAKQAYEQNSTPANQANLNKAMGLAFDRVSRFVESARSSRTDLVLGFDDLADYLEINAMTMEQQAGNNPNTKNTVKYMRRQAKDIRQFAGDFENMVDQLADVSGDLSHRASGWVAASRVMGMMQDVYGPGGTESVYNTMSSVVQAMASLKGLFNTQDMLGGSFGGEEKEANLRQARENYQETVNSYYNE